MDGGQPAQSTSITSPIGGLNARDSLAAMPPQDAVILDNFFPTPTSVDLRNGFTKQTVSLPGNVESLLPYTSGTTKKLFAASGTGFYDATTARALYSSTLNPADKGANVTLSNGNLTASVPIADFGMVRGTQAVSAGQWYWEVTVGTTPGMIGVANSTANLAGYVGQDVNGWGYYSLTGHVYNNGANTAYGATYTTGDVIGVALDMTAGTVTFYKNGVSQGVAFTGLTGMLFPAWGAESTATETATFNLGATAFAFPIPAGFNAIPVAVQSGLTNARWQWANMGTAGGQFLLTVNGLDKLRGFDGTVWWADGDGSHDITGVNTANCIHINVFKNRVWLIEKNTFHAWYLPLQSISGAASNFDLSSLFKLGGSLMAMATWTIDNAAGVQEYAVFISTEGEIAFYEGTDPTVASTWLLDGMFRVGRPVGRRCFAKVGSDVIVLTSDGAFPLSKALLTDRSQLQDALTAKIVKLVNNDVASYSSNFGWEITLFPLGNKVIINVPQQPGTTQYQYVMNTITGAWCRFTGWNANCFCVLQDVLYFGGNLSGANTGYVAIADSGTSDNSNFIFGEVQTAYQYFGAPGRLKRWTMARPVFLTAGTTGPAIRMDVDFKTVTPTSSGTFSNTGGTAWNSALWNTFLWGSNTTIQKNWQAVGGFGYAGALHMKIQNNATSLSWMSVDYVFEYGNVI